MNRKTMRSALAALALTLAAAQPAAADAATVMQMHAQAAQGWHQTYTAYGRTVTVDIPVQVPDVETLPVLRADAAAAAQTPPVTDWPDAALFQEPGFFRLDSHTAKTRQAAEPANRNDPPKGMDVQAVYREWNELEPDTPYAFDNPASVRDAQAMMDKVLTDNFPGLADGLTPYAAYATGALRAYDEAADAFSGDPWPYCGVLMVYFHQQIGGVPLLCRGESCFADFDHTPAHAQTIPVGGTAILQEMPDGSGLFQSAQFHLVSVRETLLPDLPLCSLSEVLQTYETLIEQGLLRQVTGLRLGYVSWEAEDGSLTLTPAWVLTGDLYASADTPDRQLFKNMDPRIPEHGCVIVSALTAELIDPARLDLGALYP